MVENVIYSSGTKDKYNLIEFEKLLKEQADKIIEVLELKLNSKDSVLYNDEGFKDYIEDLKNGKVDKILNPSKLIYKEEFDKAVLEFGSFEFVERLLINCSDEVANQYIASLFNDIDFKKLDSEILSKDKFSSEEAKEFIDMVIKFSEESGVMPVQYCEFLIAKIIEDNPEFNGNINEFQRLVIMENLANIKSQQLTGNKESITSDDSKFQRPKYIKINSSLLKDISMNTVLGIVTIFYDLRREEQKNQKDSKKYNHLLYMLVKEEIFGQEKYGVSKKKYSKIYEELDAEYFSLSMTSNFLQTLRLDEKFKNSRKWNSILNTIQLKLEEIEIAFDRAKKEDFSDGKLVEAEDDFDKLVIKNPEIIEKNPILKAEYNDNGSVKPTKQIFEELTEIVRIKENRLGNYDMYKYILYSRAGRNFEDCFNINDVVVPRDLSYAVRNALEKLQYSVISKGMSEIIPDFGVDKKQNIEIDIDSKEKITKKDKEKYDEIFGNDGKI